MTSHEDKWKARDKLLAESARFLFEFKCEGKTFREFHDEYNKRFGDITWKWMDEPDAPDWLESSLMAEADHLSQFVPANVAFGIDDDDLMMPAGVRDGHYHEDLTKALAKIATFESFYGQDFEDEVTTIHARLLYYHPDRREHATTAFREEIARLRRGDAGESA